MKQLPSGRYPRTQLLGNYWRQLSQRERVDEEVLKGPERLFYNLAIVRGELYTGSFPSYFEYNAHNYEEHLSDLEMTGFGDIAEALRKARMMLFGDQPITHDIIYSVLDMLYGEDEEHEDPLAEELEAMRDELMPRLDELTDYRDQLGLREGFYERLDW